MTDTEETDMTGFKAVCMSTCPDSREAPEPFRFTDRDEFVDHLKTAHPQTYQDRSRALKADENAHRFLPFKPFRTPPFRQYAPKPLSAGTRVEFSLRHEDGLTGTVWSDGPHPNTLWVIRDDMPGEAVMVRVERHRTRPYGLQQDEGRYPPSWQRDTVKRCDNVRRHQGVYAVRVERGRNGHNTVYENIYHADPECVFAKGYEPATYATREIDPDTGRVVLVDKPVTRTAHDIVDALLSQRHMYVGKFCKRCVWLNEEAEEA